jgi:glycolate oxidase
MLDELRKIFGNNVLSSAEELYPYAFDTSPNPENITVPTFVVFPENTAQTSKLVKLCAERGFAVIPRGAGTCHSGGCRSIGGSKGSVILHFSKMDKILEIDKDNLIARLEPNVVLGNFAREVEKLGLFFPPDPSNLAVSTIGGAVALCAGGPRTLKYGSTKDYIINLEVVLPSGEVIETSCNVAKSVTGYNLTQLFVGSEGTLGVITQITVRLIPRPEARSLTLAYFDTLEEASNAVNAVTSSLLTPSVLDLLDKNTLSTIEKFSPCGLLTDKAAALLIELDGFEQCVSEQQKRLEGVLSNATITRSCGNEEKIWKARRSAFGCVAKLGPNVITEDIVVPRIKIPELIRKIEKLCAKYSISVCIMGHAGDGNIHPNFALDLSDNAQARNFALLKDELFKIALELGGTLSGEHGIGCEKRKYLKDALDAGSLKYMEKIKQLFDPKNIMNPGKMF